MHLSPSAMGGDDTRACRYCQGHQELKVFGVPPQRARGPLLRRIQAIACTGFGARSSGPKLAKAGHTIEAGSRLERISPPITGLPRGEVERWRAGLSDGHDEGQCCNQDERRNRCGVRHRPWRAFGSRLLDHQLQVADDRRELLDLLAQERVQFSAA